MADQFTGIRTQTSISRHCERQRWKQLVVTFSSEVFRSVSRQWALGGVAAACTLWLLVASARAQTDEIQVYDATINAPGQFSVDLHNNYTPIGRKQPDFEGASCRTIP